MELNLYQVSDFQDCNLSKRKLIHSHCYNENNLLNCSQNYYYGFFNNSDNISKHYFRHEYNIDTINKNVTIKINRIKRTLLEDLSLEEIKSTLENYSYTYGKPLKLRIFSDNILYYK